MSNIVTQLFMKTKQCYYKRKIEKKEKEKNNHFLISFIIIKDLSGST